MRCPFSYPLTNFSIINKQFAKLISSILKKMRFLSTVLFAFTIVLQFLISFIICKLFWLFSWFLTFYFWPGILPISTEVYLKFAFFKKKVFPISRRFYEMSALYYSCWLFFPQTNSLNFYQCSNNIFKMFQAKSCELF